MATFFKKNGIGNPVIGQFGPWLKASVNTPPRIKDADLDHHFNDDGDVEININPDTALVGATFYASLKDTRASYALIPGQWIALTGCKEPADISVFQRNFLGVPSPHKRLKRHPVSETPVYQPPPSEPAVQAADVIATSASTLTTRLNAVPSNLNRRYIIGLGSGNYGTFTFPSSYNKGTTLVQIRSEGRGVSTATFTKISAQSSRNIEFENLRIWQTALDAFGFPDGTCMDLKDIRGVAPWTYRIRDCDIRGGAFGIVTTNAKRVEICYSQLRGQAIDGLRLANDNTSQKTEDVYVHHCEFSVLHPTMTFPNINTEIGYTIEPNNACDPRRSDQKAGNTDVTDLQGNVVTYDDYMKGLRHPDLIQGWGEWHRVRFHDNSFYSGNGYKQCIYYQSTTSQALAYSTDCEYLRNYFLSAHVNAVALSHQLRTIVEDNLFRKLPGCNWAQFYQTDQSFPTSVMIPAVSTVYFETKGDHPENRVSFRDNVFPNPKSGSQNNNWITHLTPVVLSNTLVPPDWETFDVALGKIGPFGYEN